MGLNSLLQIFLLGGDDFYLVAEYSNVTRQKDKCRLVGEALQPHHATDVGLRSLYTHNDTVL